MSEECDKVKERIYISPYDCNKFEVGKLLVFEEKIGITYSLFYRDKDCCGDSWHRYDAYRSEHEKDGMLRDFLNYSNGRFEYYIAKTIETYKLEKFIDSTSYLIQQ